MNGRGTHKRAMIGPGGLKSAGLGLFLLVSGAAQALAETVEELGAHEAGEHAGSGGLPQFDPTYYPSQLFWLFLTFITLYIIFSARILPDIGGIIERRDKQVQGDIDKAEQDKKNAEAALAKYESLLDTARKESSKLITETNVKIKENAQQKIKALRDKSEQEISAMEKRISQVREQARRDMTTIAAEIASEASARIIGIKTDIDQAKTAVRAIEGKEAA